MDLTYTAAEEEFRRELRSWLQANIPDEWTPPRLLGSRWTTTRASGCAGTGSATRPTPASPASQWPTEYGGRGGTPGMKAIYDEEMVLARRAAHRQPARPGLPRAHRDGHRHRRAAQGDHRAAAAQRGDLVPGLLRARRRLRPRRAVHPGASATATTSSSTGRRSGPPTPCTATRSSRWSAPSRAAQRHRGISMLLIDMHQPGVDARPLKQMSGASEFGEVFFTDARVPGHRRASARSATAGAPRCCCCRSSAARPGSRSTPSSAGSTTRSSPSRSGWAATATRCCATSWPGCSPTWSACGCTRCTCSPRSSRAATSGFEASMTKLHLVGDVPGPVGGVRRRARRGRHPRPRSTGVDLRPLHAQAMWSRSVTIWGGSSQVQRNVTAERVLGLPR